MYVQYLEFEGSVLITNFDQTMVKIAESAQKAKEAKKAKSKKAPAVAVKEPSAVIAKKNTPVDDGNDTHDAGGDVGDNDNGGEDSANTGHTEQTVPVDLVRKLRVFEALPSSIKNDKTNAWRRVVTPSWQAYIGATPNPFLNPDNPGSQALTTIVDVVYAALGIQVRERAAIKTPMWHNVSAIPSPSLSLVLIQYSKMDARFSEYKNGFGSKAIEHVYRELRKNNCSTIDEMAQYAAKQIKDDRYQYSHLAPESAVSPAYQTQVEGGLHHISMALRTYLSRKDDTATR